MITLLKLLALFAAETAVDGIQRHADLNRDDWLQTQSQPVEFRSAPPPSVLKPHILFILIDDLGWADVGWTRAEKTMDVITPNMDALAYEGVILDRHYVHYFCSPSRSAIQSGRSPTHVNVLNVKDYMHNPLDPVSGFSGIPRNMTGIAEVMKHAGYSTHMVGKWDVGMATPDHTPAGRGYDTSLVFLSHHNDCWNFKAGACRPHHQQQDIQDLWSMDAHSAFPGRPAEDVVALNHKNCSFENQRPVGGGKCVYEDQVFEERVTSIIKDHIPSEPLFVFWATRAVHHPYDTPDDEVAKLSFMNQGMPEDLRRRQYAGMVSWMDRSIGRVVTTLKEKKMYENTLIVMSSDNGGYLATGNNYPLKGGKFSHWEGGIRVAAFVSGGFVPQAARGSVQSNLVTGWDWYATFAALAGVDPTDRKAELAGLPPHDSINQWPMLSGTNSTPARTFVEIGNNAGGSSGRTDATAKTIVGGLIIPPYKIVIGDNISHAGWTGPQSLNHTSHFVDFAGMVETCGRTPETGCLFDVFADPGEHRNLANDRSDVFTKLLAEVDALSRNVFSPNRGEEYHSAACDAAINQYSGFWGPFLS